MKTFAILEILGHIEAHFYSIVLYKGVALPAKDKPFCPKLYTDMRENMLARLRDSRPGMHVIHET